MKIKLFALAVLLSASSFAQAADFHGLWEKTKEVASDSLHEAKELAAEKKAEYKAAQARKKRYIELCIDAGGDPAKCKENFGGITEGFE